jgi:hypothetical protein
MVEFPPIEDPNYASARFGLIIPPYYNLEDRQKNHLSRNTIK